MGIFLFTVGRVTGGGKVSFICDYRDSVIICFIIISLHRNVNHWGHLLTCKQNHCNLIFCRIDQNLILNFFSFFLRNFMLVLLMPEYSKQGKLSAALCKLLTGQHDAIEYEFLVALEMKEN